MNDDDQIAFLIRRLTFGSGFSAIQELHDTGPAAVREQMLAGAGTPHRSPWDGREIDGQLNVDLAVEAIGAWTDHLRTTDSPLAAWMTWFWHDHFAVSFRNLRTDISLFIGHIDLLDELRVAPFAELLRAVTIDAGMLVFLDGTRNASGAINENYGRELLELYALGIGNYDEDDVRAAAVALSGWTIPRRVETPTPRFVQRRHDATPQQLLGSTVDDLDSVISAVTTHDACADHLVAHLGERILGAAPTSSSAHTLADELRHNELDIASLLANLVDLALDGAATDIVLEPVQWLLHGEALTGPLEPRPRLSLLRAMGQLPGAPPNVGGYPTASTWAGPSTTVGRFRAASVLAANCPEQAPILEAIRASEWDAVAYLTARPSGFSATTRTAIDELPAGDGRAALAALLMSPEMAVA